MRGIAVLVFVGALGQAQTVTTVSAASYAARVAPDSIAAAFGSALADAEAQAGEFPLPAELAGTSVTVTDSAGVARNAGLYLVSPGQINFVVPEGTAPGAATITIASAGHAPRTGTVQVAAVAPGIFSANEDAKGVAAATAVRRVIPTNIQSDVPVFRCASGPGTCASVPIGLGIDTPIYVSFYGTGIRGRGALDSVTCTVGGVDVPVLFAGPQPGYPGLDQVNVPVVLALRGKGEVDVVLKVEGQAANTVRINVQ